MKRIIEPHGDDALISCYPILCDDSEPIEVITLGHSRDSAGLTKWFPHVTTKYFDLYEINYEHHLTYKDYVEWKKLRDTLGFGRDAWKWQFDETVKRTGNLYVESASFLSDTLYAYLFLSQGLFTVTETYSSSDTLYIPVGLIHPYHIAVSWIAVYLYNSIDSARFKPSLVLYSDAPYNSSKWAREIEASRCDGMSVSTVVCLIPQIDHKDQVFRDVYPTEVSRYVFNKDSIFSNTYRFYQNI